MPAIFTCWRAKAGTLAVIRSGSHTLFPRAWIRVPGDRRLGEVGPHRVAVPRHKPLIAGLLRQWGAIHHLRYPYMTRRVLSLTEMNT